jgi:hypothetical protein
MVGNELGQRVSHIVSFPPHPTKITRMQLQIKNKGINLPRPTIINFIQNIKANFGVPFHKNILEFFRNS